MKTFKPGDYCRFTPEEIPTIIALLKANGWEVNKHVCFNESHDCIVVNEEGGFHSYKLSKSIEAKNEIQRHDFIVTALRLNEGDGMRSDMSTPEQRKYISETLEKLGVRQHFLASNRTDKSYWSSFGFCGNIWLGCDEESVTNHIPYSDWCKRLNVTPIHIPDVGEKVEEKTIHNYQMDYPESGRAIHLYLKEFCDESLIFTNMIADASRRASEEIQRLRNKSILTLPDGTTVDLTKPIEVSYGGDKWEDEELEFHFVGFNNAGHIIVECLSDCELQAVDKIRNKPEQEFKPGDAINDFNSIMFTLNEIAENEKELSIKGKSIPEITKHDNRYRYLNIVMRIVSEYHQNKQQ